MKKVYVSTRVVVAERVEMEGRLQYRVENPDGSCEFIDAVKFTQYHRMISLHEAAQVMGVVKDSLPPFSGRLTDQGDADIPAKIPQEDDGEIDAQEEAAENMPEVVPEEGVTVGKLGNDPEAVEVKIDEDIVPEDVVHDSSQEITE